MNGPAITWNLNAIGADAPADLAPALALHEAITGDADAATVERIRSCAAELRSAFAAVPVEPVFQHMRARILDLADRYVVAILAGGRDEPVDIPTPFLPDCPTVRRTAFQVAGMIGTRIENYINARFITMNDAATEGAR